MRLTDAVALTDKYGECPECGNEYIGNGQGTMTIGHTTFERTCKCGWNIKVDLSEAYTPEKKIERLRKRLETAPEWMQDSIKTELERWEASKPC